eukprot:g71839.t1
MKRTSKISSTYYKLRWYTKKEIIKGNKPATGELPERLGEGPTKRKKKKKPSIGKVLISSKRIYSTDDEKCDNDSICTSSSNSGSADRSGSSSITSSQLTRCSSSSCSLEIQQIRTPALSEEGSNQSSSNERLLLVKQLNALKNNNPKDKNDIYASELAIMYHGDMKGLAYHFIYSQRQSCEAMLCGRARLKRKRCSG